MAQEYIAKINTMLSNCDNLVMLDLIYQILSKTVNGHG